VKPLLWIVTPIVVVAILRPWTVRPIERSRPAAFDAGAFASSAWPRLVREATQTATDVSEIAAGSSRPARFVKGTGVVAAVDRRSRVGVMQVRLTGSSQATVAIQIGPVIRGTALRDASSFIRFSDFTNQSDYAAAANALNDHALRTVIESARIDALQGRTVAFAGAVARSAAAREDGAIEVVPLQLEVLGAGVK
jgi:predicted lipoprotein